MNRDHVFLPIRANLLALCTLLCSTIFACPQPIDEDPVTAVQLSSFEVRLTGNQTVVIEWITEQESGNDYYLIERSSDSVYWDVLGEVGGSGDSDALVRYTFLDRQPLHGKSIYRLKQISTNTDYTYPASKVLTLDLEDPGLQIISVQPNPFVDQFSIRFRTAEEASVDIRFFDAEGRILLRKKARSQQGENVFPVQFSSPPPDGLYVISMTSREQHLRTYLMIKGQQFINTQQSDSDPQK